MACAIAATFGAGLTSMYLAQELQADVVDITWNGGNASASLPVNFSSVPGSQDIDQVIDAILPDFAQLNYYSYNYGYGGLTLRTMFVGESRGIARANIVKAGQTLSPATFAGFNVFGGFKSSTKANAYVGFIDKQNNVGWFRVDFSRMGPLVYSTGQYGNMGENLIVGENTSCAFAFGDINQDGLINLLDVAPFVEALTNGSNQCEADVNQDGTVNLLDVAPFVELLSG